MRSGVATDTDEALATATSAPAGEIALKSLRPLAASDGGVGGGRAPKAAGGGGAPPMMRREAEEEKRSPANSEKQRCGTIDGPEEKLSIIGQS